MMVTFIFKIFLSSDHDSSFNTSPVAFEGPMKLSYNIHHTTPNLSFEWN